MPIEPNALSAAAVALLAASTAFGQTSAPPPTPVPASQAKSDGPVDKLSDGIRYAKPRLISEQSGVVPGQVLNLGITFDIADGWHLYWNGLSDTGMPILITPTAAPHGVEWLEQIWPAPRRYFPAEGILDHIYERSVTVILPVRVPTTLEPGANVTFAFDLEWLVCQEACIIGQGPVSLTLQVVAADRAASSAEAPRFARTRAAAPAGGFANPTEAGDIRSEVSGDVGVISVPGARSLEFYPVLAASRPVDLIADGQAGGNELRVRLKAAGDGSPMHLGGMVRVEHPDGKVTYHWVSRKAS